MADYLGDLASAPSTGWAAIGNALAGGGGSEQRAYQTGVVQGAQSANLLEEARKRRDANLALQGINAQSFTGAQSDPNGQGGAALLSALVHAGVNPDQVASALGEMQNTSQRGQVFQQAQQPGVSVAALNPVLAALNGKPVETSKIEGNTIINPYLDPISQAQVGGNQPTAIGQADIAEKGAQAKSALAAAFEHSAQGQHALATINDVQTDSLGNAVLVNRGTGGSKPVLDALGEPVALGTKGSGGAGGKVTLPSPQEMQQAFGAPRIGGQGNPRAQDFLAWQALQAQQDPRFNNGSFALQQYALHQQGGNLAANQTASAADALGLANPIANRANATGLVQKNEDGNVVAAPTTVVSPGTTNVMAALAQQNQPQQPKSFSNDSPAEPKSKAEFDALPSGTPFINPSDGKLMRKK
jgi:hypothetical protein